MSYSDIVLMSITKEKIFMEKRTGAGIPRPAADGERAFLPHDARAREK
jgi:hypothetical protein